MKSRRLLLAMIVGLGVASAVPSVHADTYYWDNNGSTDGFGTAGGTWGTSTNWSLDGTGASAPTIISTTTADALNFGNGATPLGVGSITVTGTVSAGDMTFASSSGAITLSGGTITLAAVETITVNNATNTIGSILAGAGTSLTKAGTGTLTVTAIPTYTGATNVNAGTLVLSNPTIGTATYVGGTVNINGASTFKFTQAGGGSRYDFIGKTVNFDSVGGGTFDVSGNSNFVHALFVATNTIATNGGARNSILGNINLGVAGGVTVFNLTRGSDATVDLAVTGVLSNAAGISKTGNGILSLSGANTYFGGTTIKAGTILIGVSDSSTTIGALGGSSRSVLLGDTTGASDASLLTGGAFTIGNTITIQSGNSGISTLGGNTAAVSTFSGNINLGTASGTQKDVSLVALSGGTAIFSGVFNESTSVPNSNVTIGDSTHSGTVKLSNVANGYTGITTIGNGATLDVVKLAAGGSNSSIGNSAAAATNLIINNGTLKYTGTGDSTNRLFTIGTGGATIDASGTASTLVYSNAGSLALTGSTARTLTLTGTNTNANGFAPIISDAVAVTGVTSVTKSGVGSWSLSGANTYTGTTTLSAGTLNINSATALGSGTFAINGGTIDNTLGSALTLTNNNPLTLGGNFAYGGTNDLNLGTGAVTVAAVRTITRNGTGMLALGGTISGVGGLTFAGAGNTTLSGTNTYTGSTAVSGGILNLNGTHTASGAGAFTMTGVSTVNVNGTETIGGDLSIASTASNTSTMNVAGTLNLNGGGVLIGQNVSGATGRVHILAGGSVNVTTPDVRVANAVNGTTQIGILSLDSGSSMTINASASPLRVANGSSTSGTINLDGGTLTTARIISGAGGGGGRHCRQLHV